MLYTTMKKKKKGNKKKREFARLLDTRGRKGKERRLGQEKKLKTRGEREANGSPLLCLRGRGGEKKKGVRGSSLSPWEDR